MYIDGQDILLVQNGMEAGLADSMIMSILGEVPIIAVDCETTGLETLDNRLVCVTFASETSAAVVPWQYVTPMMREVLDDFAIHKVMHHGMFDWSYLKLECGVVTKPILDTKRLAMSKGYSNRESSLKQLCQKVLGVTLDKGLATSFKVEVPITPEQALYTAKDAMILFALLNTLIGEVPKEQIDKALVPALLRIEDCVPMQRYIDGIGPWPQYGHYPSLEKPSMCPDCPDHKEMTHSQSFCSSCCKKVREPQRTGEV